jgi:hypothetical protein
MPHREEDGRRDQDSGTEPNRPTDWSAIDSPRVWVPATVRSTVDDRARSGGDQDDSNRRQN